MIIVHAVQLEIFARANKKWCVNKREREIEREREKRREEKRREKKEKRKEKES